MRTLKGSTGIVVSLLRNRNRKRRAVLLKLECAQGLPDFMSLKDSLIRRSGGRAQGSALLTVQSIDVSAGEWKARWGAL